VRLEPFELFDDEVFDEELVVTLRTVALWSACASICR
jgi:hypothetical protein